MEQLLEILEGMRPDVDFNTENALITNSILDSFDIVGLVGELNDTFDIEIGPNELLPENFNSAEAIWALVERLMQE